MAKETRSQDRDRFLCTLFAPANCRESIYTILAFNIEIAKSREMVTESLLGEIRLQWWRDAIDHIYQASDHDLQYNIIVKELGKVIEKYNLSRAIFVRLIDTRLRDMVDKPFEDEIEYREYAHGTTVTLNKLLMKILCYPNTSFSDYLSRVVEHISLAWAFTGMLRASRNLARQNRVLLPSTLMTDCGFNEFEFKSGISNPKIEKAIEHIVQLARNEIRKARELTEGKIDKPYLSLFLQASLAEMYLDRICRLNFNPFTSKIEAGRAIRQLRLGFKAMTGFF